MLSLFLWLLIDLVIVSLGEYVAHRWFMHGPAIEAFWKPHALHHNRFYFRFDYEPHPLGRFLNLRITWPDTLMACIVAAPLALWSVPGYAILVTLAVLHRWTWNTIHSEMHLDEGRWFARMWIYRRLAWLHFLHHRHPNRNYNVTLPLIDLLLGTRAQATTADRNIWREIRLKQRMRQLRQKEAP